MFKYEIIISWSNEDEVFVALVPELLGCMAHGDTSEEALKNVNISISLWLETAKENGIKIPEPGKRVRT